MARKKRVHVNGGLYHVLLRGNWGKKIFHFTDDYLFFLQLIQEGVEKYDHKIHAFCCMTNHVHLAIQVAEVHLSRIIQNIAFRFARRINWRNRKIGHLFQGRYKAILVDAESHLLELIRYIHLNPVRARMVKDPQEYRWSSHRSYLGKAFFPWLSTRWVLDQFHPLLSPSIEAFQQFVIAGTEGNNPTRVKKEPIVFLDEQNPSRREKTPIPREFLDDLVGLVCGQYRLAECQLRSSGRSRKAGEARAVIGYLVRKTRCTTLKEVARRFDKDLSAFVRSINRIERLGRLAQTEGRSLHEWIQKVNRLKTIPGA